MKSLALIAVLSLLGSAFALMSTHDKRTIIIDAGHGGIDPGYSIENTTEAQLNLDWALSLKSEAERAGHKVILIRDSDEFIQLSDRLEHINSVDDASFLISFHMRSAPDEQNSGAKIQFSEQAEPFVSENALRIAAFLDSLIETSTGSGNYFLLNHSDLPAWIIEPGNMNNSQDLEHVKDPEFRRSFSELLIASLAETK